MIHFVKPKMYSKDDILNVFAMIDEYYDKIDHTKSNIVLPTYYVTPILDAESAYHVYCIAWTDKITRKTTHAMIQGKPLVFLEEQTANEALGHMRIRISKLRQAIAKHKLKGDNKHG